MSFLGFAARSSPARSGLLLPLVCCLLGLPGCEPVPSPSGSVEAQLEAIWLLPSALERTPRLVALLERLDLDDVPAVERVLAKRGSGPAESVLIAEWLGGLDPEAGYEAIRNGRFRSAELALAALVRAQARVDPYAARDLLAQHGHDVPVERAMMALVQGWLHSGDDGYLHFVEEMPIGQMRQKALGLIADHLVLHEGAEAALRVLEAVPADAPNRFKLQFRRRMAAALVLSDPLFAAAWAEGLYQAKDGEGVLRHVVGRWGQHEGAAPLEWLAGLPVDEHQIEAIEMAYVMWMRRDPDAAEAWALEREPDASLDPVLAVAAARLAQRDVAVALEVLAGIEDEERRRWTQLQIAVAWAAEDAEAMEAWLDEIEASAQMRELVAKSQRRRR